MFFVSRLRVKIELLVFLTLVVLLFLFTGRRFLASSAALVTSLTVSLLLMVTFSVVAMPCVTKTGLGGGLDKTARCAKLSGLSVKLGPRKNRTLQKPASHYGSEVSRRTLWAIL